MFLADRTDLDLTELRPAIAGEVLTSAEEGWDDARRVFNLLVDQQPAAIVLAETAEDVVAAVRFATRHGLRVAPQTTGHNAAPLPALADTLLVKTTNMRHVEVDVPTRRARVGAGARWEDVVPRAAEHGLAALHGSSPDVGVVGYSLGGGMGWLARKHGLQTSHVTAIELVTADGNLVQTDADTEPELFWALRGGGGNFGVVTAVEFELFAVEELYAGVMFFPVERAAEVLHTWNALLPDLPEEITSVGRILNFPPLPEIPEPMRGRSFVVVEAVFLGSEAEGAELLRPVRELGPEMDTFGPVPIDGLSLLHMDPRDPMPAMSDHRLLHALPAEGIEAMIELVGPGSPLVSVELRHTGGALGRPADGGGATDQFPGSLAMFAVGAPMGPFTPEDVENAAKRVAEALDPWSAGHYLNFVERPIETAHVYGEERHRRLQAVKAAYDPGDVFRANHPIAPRA